jgi:hypothetical protein
MQRASDDRLRTFDTHVTDLLTESGGRGTWSVQHELIAGTVETVEPHREALRSWLMAVRLLDAPREDIYLPDVLDLLEAMPIRDSTREMVGAIRQQWQDAQTTLAFIALEDTQGPITPRDAFELLAYVHHLHRDPLKQARMAAMPPGFREVVRQQGAAYAAAIAELAVYLRSIARDDPATSHLFVPAPPGTRPAADL